MEGLIVNGVDGNGNCQIAQKNVPEMKTYLITITVYLSEI